MTVLPGNSQLPGTHSLSYSALLARLEEHYDFKERTLENTELEDCLAVLSAAAPRVWESVSARTLARRTTTTMSPTLLNAIGMFEIKRCVRMDLMRRQSLEVGNEIQCVNKTEHGAIS